MSASLKATIKDLKKKLAEEVQMNDFRHKLWKEAEQNILNLKETIAELESIKEGK